MFRRPQGVVAEILNLARRPMHKKSDRDAPVGQRALPKAISPRGEIAVPERPVAALGLQTGGAHQKGGHPTRKRMHDATQRYIQSKQYPVPAFQPLDQPYVVYIAFETHRQLIC